MYKMELVMYPLIFESDTQHIGKLNTRMNDQHET